MLSCDDCTCARDSYIRTRVMMNLHTLSSTFWSPRARCPDEVKEQKQEKVQAKRGLLELVCSSLWEEFIGSFVKVCEDNIHHEEMITV